MWFLLRAVFWLSIVFASISWPQGPAAPVRVLASGAGKVQDVLGKAAAKAQAGVEEACLRAPSTCLNAAARLNRLTEGPRSSGMEKTLPQPAVVDARPVAH